MDWSCALGKVSSGHIPDCLGKGWGEERGSLGGRCQLAVYVRWARLREKDRVNLTSKTLSGKPWGMFWAPERICVVLPTTE